MRRNRQTLFRNAQPVTVTALGRTEVTFVLQFPSKTGDCELVATLNGPKARGVRSRRTVRVVGE